MRPRWLYAFIPAAIVGGCSFALLVVAAAFFLGLLFIKLWWAWAVPDLFPGAVDQGLIADSLSWWVTFKLALAIAVLAGIAASRGNKGN